MTWFIVTYVNTSYDWVDEETPVYYGFLLKASDQAQAEASAKKWENDSNNMDANVSVTKVTKIEKLEDLESHPEMFLKAE
jgi:hypothetical protein